LAVDGVTVIPGLIGAIVSVIGFVGVGIEFCDFVRVSDGVGIGFWVFVGVIVVAGTMVDENGLVMVGIAVFSNVGVRVIAVPVDLAELVGCARVGVRTVAFVVSELARTAELDRRVACAGGIARARNVKTTSIPTPRKTKILFAAIRISLLPLLTVGSIMPTSNARCHV